jgi:ribonuclease T2
MPQNSPMFKLLTFPVLMLAVTASSSCSPPPQAGAVAERPQRREGGREPGPAATRDAQQEAGAFDLYLLSLSWSPEHCASSAGGRDNQQCGGSRNFGFVVHGLWPQYEKGWPQDCGGETRVAGNVIQRMLPIMPSDRLIQHEWAKHGTCSGLSQQRYFEAVQNAFAAVRIPREYQQPIQQVNVSPEDIKGRFLAANPGMNERSVRVQCSGRFLSEVRVCLTKDLKPRACPASVRDGCRDSEIIMRPVR